MDKKKIALKRIMNTEDVIAWFEDLVKCFREGTIVIEQEDRELSFDLPESVFVEVEAKQKKDKVKFGLELAWHLSSDSSDDSEKITISPEKKEKDENSDDTSETIVGQKDEQVDTPEADQTPVSQDPEEQGELEPETEALKTETDMEEKEKPLEVDSTPSEEDEEKTKKTGRPKRKNTKE